MISSSTANNKFNTQTRKSFQSSWLWTPMGNNIWKFISGVCIRLKELGINQIYDYELTVLQEVALKKLHEWDLCRDLAFQRNIKNPSVLKLVRSGSKHFTEILFAKRSSSIFSFPERIFFKKKNKSLVFGIPIAKAIENDQLIHDTRRLSLKSENTKEIIPPPSTTWPRKRSSNNSSIFKISNLQYPVDPKIPLFVNNCLKYLEEKSLNVQGIFRVSCSKKRMTQLKSDIDSGKKFNLDDNPSPHDVAGLLKEYFRELPEPLMTNELHQSFLITRSFENDESRIKILNYLLCLLPETNRDTLQALIVFLNKVTQFADDKYTRNGEMIYGNKMDARNLSVIFGPNILHTYRLKKLDLSQYNEEMMEERRDAIKVIQFMIENAAKLFKVDADLLNELYIYLYQNDPDLLENSFQGRYRSFIKSEEERLYVDADDEADDHQSFEGGRSRSIQPYFNGGDSNAYYSRARQFMDPFKDTMINNADIEGGNYLSLNLPVNMKKRRRSSQLTSRLGYKKISQRDKTAVVHPVNFRHKYFVDNSTVRKGKSLFNITGFDTNNDMDDRKQQKSDELSTHHERYNLNNPKRDARKALHLPRFGKPNESSSLMETDFSSDAYVPSDDLYKTWARRLILREQKPLVHETFGADDRTSDRSFLSDGEDELNYEVLPNALTKKLIISSLPPPNKGGLRNEIVLIPSKYIDATSFSRHAVHRPHAVYSTSDEYGTVNDHVNEMRIPPDADDDEEDDEDNEQESAYSSYRNILSEEPALLSSGQRRRYTQGFKPTLEKSKQSSSPILNLMYDRRSGKKLDSLTDHARICRSGGSIPLIKHPTTPPWDLIIMTSTNDLSSTHHVSNGTTTFTNSVNPQFTQTHLYQCADQMYTLPKNALYYSSLSKPCTGGDRYYRRHVSSETSGDKSFRNISQANNNRLISGYSPTTRVSNNYAPVYSTKTLHKCTSQPRIYTPSYHHRTSLVRDNFLGLNETGLTRISSIEDITKMGKIQRNLDTKTCDNNDQVMSTTNTSSMSTRFLKLPSYFLHTSTTGVPPSVSPSSNLSSSTGLSQGYESGGGLSSSGRDANKSGSTVESSPIRLKTISALPNFYERRKSTPNASSPYYTQNYQYGNTASILPSNMYAASYFETHQLPRIFISHPSSSSKISPAPSFKGLPKTKFPSSSLVKDSTPSLVLTTKSIDDENVSNTSLRVREIKTHKPSYAISSVFTNKQEHPSKHSSLTSNKFLKHGSGIFNVVHKSWLSKPKPTYQLGSFYNEHFPPAVAVTVPSPSSNQQFTPTTDEDVNTTKIVSHPATSLLFNPLPTVSKADSKDYHSLVKGRSTEKSITKYPPACIASATSPSNMTGSKVQRRKSVKRRNSLLNQFQSNNTDNATTGGIFEVLNKDKSLNVDRVFSGRKNDRFCLSSTNLLQTVSASSVPSLGTINFDENWSGMVKKQVNTTDASVSTFTDSPNTFTRTKIVKKETTV